MQSPIQIVPLHENQVPAGTPLKSELTSFWRKLFSSSRSGYKGVEVDALQRLNERRLEKQIPQLDESHYLEAFDQLPEYKNRSADELPIFLIEPPFSYLDDKLISWGRNSGRKVIEPPANILDSSPEIPKEMTDTDWIIPNLERWFVRHPRGLEHVRTLFRHLIENDTSRGIVVCHSWSWSYLQKAIGIQSVTNRIFTLKSTHVEPFSREILTYVCERTSQDVEIRQTNNGEVVLKWLPKSPDASDSSAPPLEIGDFMNQLITYSRGNRAVAVSIWKKSLRTEPDEELENIEDEKSRDHFWVVPWSELDLPDVPSDYHWKHLTILHTLLIHERLSQELLNKLLPQNYDELTMLLNDLINRDLILRDGRQFRVTEIGYPSVRHQLNKHGYRTDML